MQGNRLLREWRAASGLSQADMARSLGVSQPTYWAWEREDAIPKIEQGLAIERVTEGSVPVVSWARPDDVTEGAAP
jgi:DNA-binding XRE family transcriptional regulator